MKQDLPQLTMEFAYTDGHVAERRLLPLAVPRGKQRKGQIYVLIGTEGPSGDSFVEHLRKQIADAFYRDPSRSLTSSLVRAIQRANEELFVENERAIRTDRHYATVVCVVLRGEDAYFALVGRAAAFLVSPGGCERFGRGDPRPGERPVDLLGQVDDVDVELHHRPFDEGASVVLTTSGLLDLLGATPEDNLRCDPERLISTVRRLSEEGRGRRAFRSLVIAPEGGDDDSSDDADVEDEPPPISRRDRQELTDPNGRERRIPSIPPRLLRSPEPVAIRSPLAPTRADLQQRPRPFIPETRSFPGDAPDWEKPEREPIPRSQPRPERPMIRYRGDVFDEASESLPDVPYEPRPRVGSAKTPRLARPAILPFEPESEEPPLPIRRRPRRSMPRLDVIGLLVRLIKKPTFSWRAVLVAALVVGLFFLGYVLFLIPARILRGGAPYTDAMARLSQAQQLEQQALGQSDALVRRHLLEEAEVLSQAALSAQPNDNAVVTVSARIEKEYRSATGITDLPAPTRLVQLPTAGDELVRSGTDLYVLDRANSLIYKYLLNADGTQILPAQNPTLVRKGDHIGAATVGQLSHIAWMPAGSARAVPALLALDTAGFLVEYDPTHGLTTQRLRASDSWTDVTAIGAYAGSLYVLNDAHQTLAWYPPQSDGYSGPVYNYFAPGVTEHLADAVDLVVADNLYILHSSGTVQKFADGRPIDFAGPPSDLMPSHPAGVGLGGNSIFIGDPEHADIVQLLTSGAYQRELRAGSNVQILHDMRDLIVSNDAKSLYVLSGKSIYRFSIPGMPGSS